MNHPTFDSEEEFWDWWDEAVADKANYVHPMVILQRAKLRIEAYLDKRRFLTTEEQKMIIEAARQLAYFNPPAS